MEDDKTMKDLIESFYSAMSEKNAEGMVVCYHSDIEFIDPAFGLLKGKRAGDMWRMLMQSQKEGDFRITYSKIRADERRGEARLDAYYTFSRTGNKVHNIIRSEFEFSDGKIIRQHDRFNLYRWSRQAMGWKGWLIGWTPWFSTKMKNTSNRILSKWIEQNDDL